jgi:DNA-binding NtrC family response regulator
LTQADLQIPATRRDRLARGSHTNIPTIAEDPEGEDTDVSLDLRTALENVERRLIERALQRAGGNRTEAAALLGLNRTTLVEKLRKYAA